MELPKDEELQTRINTGRNLARTLTEQLTDASQTFERLGRILDQLEIDGLIDSQDADFWMPTRMFDDTLGTLVHKSSVYTGRLDATWAKPVGRGEPPPSANVSYEAIEISRHLRKALAAVADSNAEIHKLLPVGSEQREHYDAELEKAWKIVWDLLQALQAKNATEIFH